MVTILGNAVNGGTYPVVRPDLPRVDETPMPAHRPWCVDCKRTGRVLDDDDRCEPCTRAVASRAAQRQRWAAAERAERVQTRPPKPAKKPKRTTPGRPGRQPIPLPVQEIKARYLDGESVSSLATEFSVGRETIANRLREVGVDVLRRGGRHLRIERTPELIENVRALYVDQQHTIAHVADEIDRSPKFVLRILTELGIDRRPASAANRKIPATEHPALAELYAAGQSTSVIAAAYDVTPTAIAYILKKNGVQLRPRGAR